MKSQIITIALLAFVGVHADISTRIINGTTSAGAPYYAHVTFINNDGFGFFGGGALISPQHVLTCAHAVVGFHFWTVGLGSTILAELQRWTATAIAHPEYSPATRDNDIAILTLANAVQFTANIQPIALPAVQGTTIPLESEQGRISGFGWQSVDPIPSARLMTIFQRVTSDLLCGQHFIYTVPNHFCAFDTSQVNICMGDLGGGFIVAIRGVDTLVGLASIVDGDCNTANPALYTRVQNYRDWIRTNTNV